MYVVYCVEKGNKIVYVPGVRLDKVLQVELVHVGGDVVAVGGDQVKVVVDLLL